MGLLLKLFLKSGECKTIFTDHCLMLVNVRGLLYLAKVIILLKKDIIYSMFTDIYPMYSVYNKVVMISRLEFTTLKRK